MQLCTVQTICGAHPVLEKFPLFCEVSLQLFRWHHRLAIYTQIHIASITKGEIIFVNTCLLPYAPPHPPLLSIFVSCLTCTQVSADHLRLFAFNTQVHSDVNTFLSGWADFEHAPDCWQSLHVTSSEGKAWHALTEIHIWLADVDALIVRGLVLVYIISGEGKKMKSSQVEWEEIMPRFCFADFLKWLKDERAVKEN